MFGKTIWKHFTQTSDILSMFQHVAHMHFET